MKLAWAAALLIGLSFAAELAMLDANRGYWWDEAVYLGLAQGLNHGYGLGPARLEAFRPPLFPFAIALPLTGGEQFVKIMVVAFGAIAVAATYHTGKRLFDQRIATVAALLLATNPLFVFFSTRMLSETLSAALTALVLLFFVSAKGRMKWHALAGVSLGALFLVKYAAPLLLLPLVAHASMGKEKPRNRARNMAIMISAFLLALAPWLYLSYLNYGSPLTAYATNWSIFQGNEPTGPDYYFARFFDVFGPAGIFLLAGWYLMAGKNNRNRLLLLVTLLPLLAFTLFGHKEMRYLLQFMPAYALVAACGAAKTPALLKNGKHYKSAIAALVLLFSAFSLYSGIATAYAQAESGSAATMAAQYVALAAGSDATIMTQDYPYIFYVAQRNFVFPPADETALAGVIEASNVKYIIADRFEPSNPPYFGKLDKTYARVQTFGQWGDSEAVSVYKTKR